MKTGLITSETYQDHDTGPGHPEQIARVTVINEYLRKVNNKNSKKIFKSIHKQCINSDIDLKKCKILILGITFKENCSDIRNSRVINLYNHFKKLNNNVDVYDPYADKNEVYQFSGIKLIDRIMKKYEVVILAVAHDQFLEIDYKNILNANYVLYDVKSILPKKLITLRL